MKKHLDILKNFFVSLFTRPAEENNESLKKLLHAFLFEPADDKTFKKIIVLVGNWLNDVSGIYDRKHNPASYGFHYSIEFHERTSSVVVWYINAKNKTIKITLANGQVN